MSKITYVTEEDVEHIRYGWAKRALGEYNALSPGWQKSDAALAGGAYGILWTVFGYGVGYAFGFGARNIL